MCCSTGPVILRPATRLVPKRFVPKRQVSLIKSPRKQNVSLSELPPHGCCGQPEYIKTLKSTMILSAESFELRLRGQVFGRWCFTHFDGVSFCPVALLIAPHEKAGTTMVSSGTNIFNDILHTFLLRAHFREPAPVLHVLEIDLIIMLELPYRLSIPVLRIVALYRVPRFLL